MLSSIYKKKKNDFQHLSVCEIINFILKFYTYITLFAFFSFFFKSLVLNKYNIWLFFALIFIFIQNFHFYLSRQIKTASSILRQSKI